MKKQGKNMKIVYGPVHPVVKKEEMIKIPSEKAGEKRIVTLIDLQNELTEFLELQTNSHICELARDARMTRLTKEGKIILTDKEKREQGNDRGDR